MTSIDDSVQGVQKYARKIGVPMHRLPEIVAEYNVGCTEYRTVHFPPMNLGFHKKGAYGLALVQYNSSVWAYAAVKARNTARAIVEGALPENIIGKRPASDYEGVDEE